MPTKKERAYSTVKKEVKRLADEKASKPAKKANWVDKLKTGVSEYFSAKKSIGKMKKIGKKIKRRKKGKDTTTRTKGIADRLRQSGMSDDQIKRLRGR